MAKVLLALVRVLAAPFINGLVWSIGAATGEVVVRNYGKGLIHFMRTKLLFHPKITFTAGCLTIASFCTLIASIALPLHKAPVIGKYADGIVATAMCVGPFAAWVATYGRSPASAVDNNQVPK